VVPPPPPAQSWRYTSTAAYAAEFDDSEVSGSVTVTTSTTTVTVGHDPFRCPTASVNTSSPVFSTVRARHAVDPQALIGGSSICPVDPSDAGASSTRVRGVHLAA
jgi:hypothetical protein